MVAAGAAMRVAVEHEQPDERGDSGRHGGRVEITARTPPGADGRRLTFTVQAVDGSGQVVAAGEIDRVIADRDRFLAAASDAHAGH
jgi:predicted thioesterase